MDFRSFNPFAPVGASLVDLPLWAEILLTDFRDKLNFLPTRVCFLRKFTSVICNTFAIVRLARRFTEESAISILVRCCQASLAALWKNGDDDNDSPPRDHAQHSFPKQVGFLRIQ